MQRHVLMNAMTKLKTYLLNDKAQKHAQQALVALRGSLHHVDLTRGKGTQLAKDLCNLFDCFFCFLLVLKNGYTPI